MPTTEKLDFKDMEAMICDAHCMAEVACDICEKGAEWLYQVGHKLPAEKLAFVAYKNRDMIQAVKDRFYATLEAQPLK